MARPRPGKRAHWRSDPLEPREGKGSHALFSEGDTEPLVISKLHQEPGQSMHSRKGGGGLLRLTLL